MNEGQYWGYRTGAVTTLSRAGNPQMEITWSVTNVLGENGEYEELPQPVEVKQYIVLTEDRFPDALKRLEPMGFNGDFNNPTFSEDADGKGQALVCSKGKQRNTQDQPRDWWDLAIQQDRQVVPENVGKQLSARWKAHANKPTKVKPAAGDTRKKLEQEAPF